MDMGARGQSHCLKVVLFLNVPGGNFPSRVLLAKDNGQYTPNHPRVARMTPIGFECLEGDFAKASREGPEPYHSIRIDRNGGTFLCLQKYGCDLS